MPNAHAGQPKQPDALSRARVQYNLHQFDQAIATAETAARVPALADRARLVIGRSYLEKFRSTGEAADLESGRNALRQVQVQSLPARERTELLLGLGEGLYLDNLFGAAADIFDSALAGDADMDIRDSALDWWATSLDRLAQFQAPEDREATYARIVERVQRELQLEPASTAGAYWLAAASRGLGGLQDAWDAAISGWVRALLSPAGGPALREDLERLVTIAIIPERAREMADNPADREKAIASLKAEWEGVKSNWK
ncbi:MAG: hypothetical protein ACM3NQ_19535 [Bacteroidales bacterium]